MTTGLKRVMGIRWFSGFFALLMLAGCAVNPVTGERTLNFMSEDWERSVGAEQYAPLRQAQSGDFILDPELTTYVQGIGDKLAMHAKRDLDWEFHILNDSTPNAWALPGGKIVVNRGLLTELDSEAELAAVLGHELVHADAAHGARAQSKGVLTQLGVLGGMLLLESEVDDSSLQQVGMLGIQLGAQLVTVAYGRDAERESDLYGMQYMSAAGYDPQGAVDLQETFVELSEGRDENWLSGLFASHPPSRERVENNRQTAASLPVGGEWARERYQDKLAYLVSLQPAYDAYDQGRKALVEEKAGEASKLAHQAIEHEPKEALFYGLLGDSHRFEKNYKKAELAYSEALKRDQGFYYYYLRRGQVRNEMERFADGREDLERSNELLPTSQANYLLGTIAQRSGDQQQAMQYFKTAAVDTNSSAGKFAHLEVVSTELPRNPGKYIHVQAVAVQGGRVAIEVDNRSPVAVRNVVVKIRYLDGFGQVQQYNQTIKQTLSARKQTSIISRLSGIPAEQLHQRVAVRVVGAKVAN
ncbi:MAG: M48 family metalloprotease [Gammaproteobacteria bacterium]|nr:M48 family metalloprotease [Gammaproteobacteria bacterium]